MFITRYTSCSRMFKEDFARPRLTDQRQSTRDEKKMFKNINETLLKQLGRRNSDYMSNVDRIREYIAINRVCKRPREAVWLF